MVGDRAGALQLDHEVGDPGVQALDLAVLHRQALPRGAVAEWDEERLHYSPRGLSLGIIMARAASAQRGQ